MKPFDFICIEPRGSAFNFVPNLVLNHIYSHIMEEDKLAASTDDKTVNSTAEDSDHNSGAGTSTDTDSNSDHGADTAKGSDGNTSAGTEDEEEDTDWSEVLRIIPLIKWGVPKKAPKGVLFVTYEGGPGPEGGFAILADGQLAEVDRCCNPPTFNILAGFKLIFRKKNWLECKVVKIDEPDGIDYHDFEPEYSSTESSDADDDEEDAEDEAEGADSFIKAVGKLMRDMMTNPPADTTNCTMEEALEFLELFKKLLLERCCAK